MFQVLKLIRKGETFFLACNDEVATALQQACERDFHNEAMILLKATRIIRRDMLDTKSKFNGTFNNSCEQESVPETLKTLIGMILGGPDIKTQSSDMTEAQTSLSISQLMLFNATKRRRDSGTTGASYYYSRDRKPPLPIYLGLVTLGDKLLQSGIVWDCRSRMIECWNYRLTWETVFAGALNQKESFVHLSFLKKFSQLLLWTILTTTRVL